MWGCHRSSCPPTGQDTYPDLESAVNDAILESWLLPLLDTPWVLATVVLVEEEGLRTHRVRLV